MDQRPAEWLAFLLFAGLCVLGAIGLLLAYEAWCTDRIYPGVHVWGVPVGGMRPYEAAQRLQAALVLPTVTFAGPGQSWTPAPTDIGLRLEAEATAQAAFRVGREPGDGPLSHLILLITGYPLSPILSYDEGAARLYLQTLAKLTDIPPVEASLTLEGTRVWTTTARPGRALDVEGALLALRQAIQSPTGGTVTLVVRDILPQVADAEAARAHAEALLSQPFAILLPDPHEGDPGPWFLS
ncbi:MAG: hypothetical protein D6793_06590, partial [Thermoflexia bacterium]